VVATDDDVAEGDSTTETGEDCRHAISHTVATIATLVFHPVRFIAACE